MASRGEPKATAPKIAVAGAALADDWLQALLEVRVERAFQVPSRVTLRFTDPGHALLTSGKFSLGTEFTVSAIDQPDLAKVEVTGFTVDHQPLTPPELVVVGHDKAHRLGRATAVATFQDMSYSAIVTQLAQDAGLTATVGDTRRRLDYMLQVESSLALISALANRVGFDWWVEENTLYFKAPDTTSQVTLTIDDDLISFSVRATGQRPDSVAVRGWDHKTQQSVTANSSSSDIAPTSTLAGMVGNPGGKFGGTANLLSANVAAASADEAQELSDALMLRSVAGSVTARGVAYGDGRIKPGVTVEISGYGPLDGHYHVTEVDHVFRPSIGFQTRFTAGDRRPTTLVDTLGNGNGNGNGISPMVASLGRSALVIGTVTNVQDPDEKGKIRVKFTGLSDEDESAWARLVSIGGGQKRGVVFIPEVGDEVLVGFENGDVRQPVVFGGLFGSKLDIPKWDVTDGKVSARRITSREGHYVELSDGEEDTAKHIQLMLQGDQHKLRLGADRFDLALPAGKPALIKIGETQIEVTSSGDINMKAPNINIKGDAKVSIEAPQIDVKAQGQLNLQAVGTTNVKGAMIAVDATGTATIKGTGAVMIN
jgi:uncharacterized protein involved in type VI secretion and phage assembly